MIRQYSANVGFIALLKFLAAPVIICIFLCQVLPPERVDRIVLLDKAWPLISQAKNEKHQINWDHIYYQDWPILLTTSKRNLKVSSGLRDLDKASDGSDSALGPFSCILPNLIGLTGMSWTRMVPHLPALMAFACRVPR